MWEKKIKRIILGLVWKFRNIGYKDPMYAPSVMASVEALSNAKMEMVELQKKTKLRPQDFEDLVGEANVILAELLAMQKAGMIDNVEDELYNRVKTTFLNLYRDCNKYGLIAVPQEEGKNVPADETPYSMMLKGSWEGRATKGLHPDKQVIAQAIISNDERLTKHVQRNRFSKKALKRFCMEELEWSERRFNRAIADCKHVKF